jgi:hypothetical protein
MGWQGKHGWKEKNGARVAGQSALGQMGFSQLGLDAGK